MAEQPNKTVASKPARQSSAKPDLTSVGGLALALTGIIGGLILEGGTIGEIAQPTAALIVFGGTIGAVLLTSPLHAVRRAGSALMSVFFEKQRSTAAVIDEIIGYATKARKSGIVSLEQDAEIIEDRFLQKALNLAVDGTDLQEIRKMMELEIGLEEQRAEAEAKVFEQAGGYAPTIGIIGAVMGLIQVMKNLANIDEVGRGIAVAFVATIYGVGSANIFFIPAANKIRARAHAAAQLKELMLEGVTAIVEGLNPKLIRVKLEAYVPPAESGKGKKESAKQPKTAASRSPAQQPTA